MIVVAGHWELSWNTPIKEAELWNLPLRDFGVMDWYMWPVSGIQHNEERKVRLYERCSMHEILEEMSHLPHVYVEPFNRAFPQYVPVSLIDFEHPTDVMYVFGSAHYNPVTYNTMREQDFMVAIPTAGNNGVLWPHQCFVTIMYDRMMKDDSRNA
jgi:hypothetical protein